MSKKILVNKKVQVEDEKEEINLEEKR